MFSTHKASKLNEETREAIRTRMYQAYNLIDGAEMFLFAFVSNGAVYTIALNSDQFEQFTYLDTASRGAGYSIRAKATPKLKAWALNNGAKLFCSLAYFKDEKAALRTETGKSYNDGEVMEHLLNVQNGKTWEKDNRASDQCGDIIINGVDYQVKAHISSPATLANEKRLHHMGVWAC